MPVLQVADIVQIQIFTQCVEQVSINSFHYRVVGVGAPPATDQDAADYLATLVAGDVKPLLQNNASYLGCGARIINSLPLPSQVLSANGAGVGTAGAVGLPRQSCGLISFKTGYAGPGHRGRMYVPFPAAADNGTGGTAIAGYVSKLDALAGTLMGPLLVSEGGRTATLDPVVWSRKLVTFFNIITYATTNRWATQRKRGSFGRANASPFG